MKMFVEMTDKQYEKYKEMFKSKTLQKVGLFDYLEANGFEYVRDIIPPDYVTDSDRYKVFTNLEFEIAIRKISIPSAKELEDTTWFNNLSKEKKISKSCEGLYEVEADDDSNT